MPHLPETSSQTYELHGVTFNSFIAGRSGATQLASWRADFAPATVGELHVMSEEEVLYVLDGTLDIEIDDERFAAHGGAAVLVPRGARFRVSNNTTAPAKAWVTTRLGMRVVMHDSGQEILPPWAQ